MFTMGWFGEAAAASLTIDLRRIQPQLLFLKADTNIPDILPLPSYSPRRPERVTAH